MSASVSTLDEVVNQLTEVGEGQTDHAYWVYRSFAERAAERLDDEELESLLISVIADEVDSVRVNFVDTSPEIFDSLDVDVHEFMEPTPALVRLALGMTEEDPRSAAAALMGLSQTPDEIAFTLE
jgi:hypothetical protein